MLEGSTPEQPRKPLLLAPKELVVETPEIYTDPSGCGNVRAYVDTHQCQEHSIQECSIPPCLQVVIDFRRKVGHPGGLPFAGSPGSGPGATHFKSDKTAEDGRTMARHCVGAELPESHRNKPL